MSNLKHYPDGVEPGPEAFRAALQELSDALFKGHRLCPF